MRRDAGSAVTPPPGATLPDAADCLAAPWRQGRAGAVKCAFSRRPADAALLILSSRGVERYAKRMLVENNIEDRVNFFQIDAL